MDEQTILSMLTPMRTALKKIEEDRNRVLAALTQIEALARSHGLQIAEPSVLVPAVATMPTLATESTLRPARHTPAPGTLSIRNEVAQILKEAAGAPVTADELWKRISAMGATTRAPDPVKLINSTASNLRRAGVPIQRVGVGTWQWIAETEAEAPELTSEEAAAVADSNDEPEDESDELVDIPDLGSPDWQDFRQRDP